jgi:hypothetical protein
MNGSAVHCDATCSPENPIESTMAAMRKGPLAEPFSKRLFLRLSSLKKDVLTRVISVRALRRDSRATKTEPRNRGGRTEKRKDLGERLERM